MIDRGRNAFNKGTVNALVYLYAADGIMMYPAPLSPPFAGLHLRLFGIGKNAIIQPLSTDKQSICQRES